MQNIFHQTELRICPGCKASSIHAANGASACHGQFRQPGQRRGFLCRDLLRCRRYTVLQRSNQRSNRPAVWHSACEVQKVAESPPQLPAVSALPRSMSVGFSQPVWGQASNHSLPANMAPSSEHGQCDAEDLVLVTGYRARANTAVTFGCLVLELHSLIKAFIH